MSLYSRKFLFGRFLQPAAFSAVEKRPDGKLLIGAKPRGFKQPMSVIILVFGQIIPHLNGGVVDHLRLFLRNAVPGPIGGLVDAFALLVYGVGYLISGSELSAS